MKIGNGQNETGILYIPSNRDVLDKISMSENNELLFDNNKIEGSGASIASINNNIIEIKIPDYTSDATVSSLFIELKISEDGNYDTPSAIISIDVENDNSIMCLLKNTDASGSDLPKFKTVSPSGIFPENYKSSLFIDL